MVILYIQIFKGNRPQDDNVIIVILTLIAFQNGLTCFLLRNTSILKDVENQTTLETADFQCMDQKYRLFSAVETKLYSFVPPWG